MYRNRDFSFSDFDAKIWILGKYVGNTVGLKVHQLEIKHCVWEGRGEEYRDAV